MNLDLMMAGVHSSGKTTFLAALFELAQAKVDGRLALRQDPEDREYFFEISQQWLQLEEMNHSNIAAPRNTSMPLRSVEGVEFDLQIPDVAGEEFGSAWEGKAWPAEVDAIASKANGLLLFLHGADLEPPLRLPPGEPPTSEPVEQNEDEGKADWDPATAPTQTILADLLEGVRDRNELMPTAVIVSAWDRVLAGEQVMPGTWLQTNLPLLWQMLEGRSEDAPYRVFGVSAQGGDISNEAKREDLAKRKPPYERILVQDGEHVSSDIGSPVAWLLAQTRGDA